jgi:hypothetical protein
VASLAVERPEHDSDLAFRQLRPAGHVAIGHVDRVDVVDVAIPDERELEWRFLKADGINGVQRMLALAVAAVRCEGRSGSLPLGSPPR